MTVYIFHKAYTYGKAKGVSLQMPLKNCINTIKFKY